MSFFMPTRRELHKITPHVTTGVYGLNINGLPIKDDLAFWYVADTEYVTKDGSDYVSQWNDISGNSRHLTQATGSYQPLWVDDLQNGHPGIRFGTNDTMQKSFTRSLPQTHYVVVKLLNDVNGYVALCTPAGTLRFCKYTGRKIQLYNGAYGPYVNMPDGEFALVMGIFHSGNTGTIRLNDDEPISANAGSWTTMDGVKIKYFNSGDSYEFCEIIGYDADHSENEQDLMIAYLMTKYGL